MAKAIVFILFTSAIFTGFASCNRSGAIQDANNTEPAKGIVQRDSEAKESTMKVKIGSSIFKAKLYDNASAAALKAKLPLTLEMIELNGNEKYVDLPANLPINATNPGTIQNGDIMLWGANTLVLFYKTFETTYSYTQLGRLDDPAGLAAAVGTGSVTVILELE